MNTGEIDRTYLYIIQTLEGDALGDVWIDYQAFTSDIAAFQRVSELYDEKQCRIVERCIIDTVLPY